MPLPKVQPVEPKATAQDVKRSAAVGNAVMAYFLQHGTFPTTKEELKAQYN